MSRMFYKELLTDIEVVFNRILSVIGPEEFVLSRVGTNSDITVLR